MDLPLKPQLAYTPEVVGEISSHSALVLGGMGGSALPALLLKHLEPERAIFIHRDYSLPAVLPEDALYVAASYSGNTEETISFARAVQERGLPLAAMANGGKLLELAQSPNIPHVVVPGGMQPRDAIIAATKALAALVGAQGAIDALNDTAEAEAVAQDAASAITEVLKGKIPVVYASRRNEALSYVSKIVYNETAKVPAFANSFPELNHNEMQGVDPLGGTAPLSEQLSILILRDGADEPEVLKRMDVYASLIQEKGVRVTVVPLPEGAPAYKLVWTWALARAAAHELAAHYGVEADEVPLVEEFKKRLKA